MEKWKPINFGGTIYYNPLDEVWARALLAIHNGDSYVAIPTKLAKAVFEFRECKSTIPSGLLDNELLVCRRPENHVGMDHFNGYLSWK